MKDIQKLDITTKSGHLHIEGYPTAQRLAKLPPELGKEISDLRLHEFDLKFCEKAMQKYKRYLSVYEHLEKTHDNAIDITIYYIAILTKFIGCFKKSKARTRLTKEKVLKDDPEAIEVFDYFEAIRDKHIAHDENALNISSLGVVLGKDNEIIDVISLNVIADLASDIESLQNLYNLIDHSIKYVQSEIDPLIKNCLKQLKKTPKDELEKFPDIKAGLPELHQIFKKREY